MAPYMTPPRYSSDPSSPKMNSDPLLAGSPVMKTKSIPSDGTVGGFPVKFLDMVVRPELPSDVDKLQDIYAVCVGGVSFYVLSTSLGAKFVCSFVIVTTFCRLAGSPLEVTCMKFYLPVLINCRDVSL